MLAPILVPTPLMSMPARLDWMLAPIDSPMPVTCSSPAVSTSILGSSSGAGGWSFGISSGGGRGASAAAAGVTPNSPFAPLVIASPTDLTAPAQGPNAAVNAGDSNPLAMLPAIVLAASPAAAAKGAPSVIILFICSCSDVTPGATATPKALPY